MNFQDYAKLHSFFLFYFLIYFESEEKEENSIFHTSCSEKAPSKCTPSIVDPLLSSPVCQKKSNADERVQQSKVSSASAQPGGSQPSFSLETAQPRQHGSLPAEFSTVC